MKKKKVIKQYKPNENEALNKAEESIPVFSKNIRTLPVTKDFTYAEFKKIADKAPFSQAEWATILHLSERTLQRYAKNNGSFAAINAERAMQIAKVLKEAKITFGSVEKFYAWIKRNPYMLEGNLSFNSLTSYDGIEKVLTQLGRIQHGIFA
ncbi:type II RES/Xre toxin-antitoxin system antitoxin [Ferruginibacter sp. SUN002]|uniref:type II RES/Xre toxin-antitoxin system antitoxin n=1 Tax=Ferruginibacter sp. SUN002 TaxID=2937789 RepID=UPI003D36F639